jgi:uncharacterized protein (DUF2141 family)
MIKLYRFLFSVFVLLLMTGAGKALAQANVTIVQSAAVGGVKACVGGGYVNMSNISISETNTGGALDDDAIGGSSANFTGVTLTLGIPSDFEFEAGTGTVTSTPGGDDVVITAYTITASAISITMNITNATADKYDAITISGLRVRAISGAAQTVNITRTGGTAVITGLANGAVLGSVTSSVAPVAAISSSDADNLICAGDNVTFTATPAAQANYEFFVGGVSVANGTSATYATTSLTNGIGTYVRVTNADGCAANSSTITTTVRALPTVQTVSAPGSTTYCAGSPNVTVRVNNSQAGFTYELYKNAAATGSTLAGTGAALDFINLDAGTYTVQAYYGTAPSCITSMSGSVTVTQTATPVVYNVTGGGTYCSGGAGLSVGLSDSDTGVSYQLLLGGAPVGTPITGTGSAIDFGLQTTAGNYTVEATSISSPACGPVAMNGTVSVTVRALPTVQTVSAPGSTTYCAGSPNVTVRVNNSQAGFTYELYKNAAATGTTLAGTGAALDFINLDAGTYTVQAYYGTAPSCITSMSGSVTVTQTATPVVYNVTGGGAYCSGGSGVSIGLSSSDVGVEYRLIRGGAPIGSPVSGTGAAISFGFHTTAGTYTIEATSISSPACGPVTMSGSAVVVINPIPVFTIANITPSICEGVNANITLTSPTAGAVITLTSVNYNGLTGTTNYTGGETFSTGDKITESFSNPGNTPLTVTYTFSVAANGCANPTTQQTSITVNPDPTFSIANTTPTICEGTAANITLTSPTTNAVITLSNINYNGATGGTYTGGETFTSGQKITETLGNPTDAPITVTYEFTVAANGCNDPTPQQTTITINPAPPVFSIANLTTSICEGVNANITLTSPTAGAVITLDNVNYNGLVGTTNYAGGETFSTGDKITESFSNPGNTPLTVTYTFSVAANGCANPTTQQTSITVNPDPTFTIANTTPTICEGTAANITLTSPTTGAVITLSNINYNGATGGTYTGGETFTSGQKITETLGNPTDAPITVTYEFTVAANGCNDPTPQQTTITINPAPPVFSIANLTTSICEGVAADIELTSPTAGAVITLTGVNYNGLTGTTNYAGGETFSTGDKITESFSNPGNTPLTVTYTFSVAANGCANPTTQQTSITVNPDPTFSIANTTPTICEGTAANITLSSPTTGAVITLSTINYNGATGGTYTGGETFTNGQKITETLGNPTDAPITVTYEFTVAANGCNDPTPQQTTITINPAPPVFSIANLTTSICEGVAADIELTSPTAGAVITLDNVNYNGLTGTTNYAGGETFNTGDKITESFTNPGNTPLTVTYTFSVAANGCANPTTQQTSITVNPDPTFSIANTTPTICEGTAANITLSSPTTGAVITLSTINYNGATGGTYTGGETFTNGQKINETLGNPTDAPITVTYEFTVAANGCNDPTPQQTTITINPAPPVFSIANLTTNICEGVAADIELTSPTAGAVITLTSVNYNGLTGTTNYAGGETFNTGDKITESFSNPGNTPLTVTYTFSVAANGCANPTTQQTSITVNPDPTFSIANTTPTICEGTAANITLSSPTTNAVITLSSINYNGATGGTYTGGETFTNGQKITETLGNPTDAPITVTYEFTVAANGCNDPTPQQTTIKINPAPPVFSIANLTTSICEGVAADIELTSPTAGAVITLTSVNYNGLTGTTNYAGGETFSTGDKITESFTNPGNTPLTVTYTFSVAANGCANPTTQQTSITVNPDPTFSIANTTPTICEGTAANITLSSPTTGAVITLSSINYNGATGGTYTGGETFTNGQKITETLGNPTDAPITVTYEFTVAANGCNDPTPQQTTITINPAPPVFSIANLTTSICEGVAADIELTSPTAGAVITLDNVNYSGLVGTTNYAGGETFSTGDKITESFSNPGNTPLTVTYTFSVAANGCSNPTTQQTSITVNPSIILTAGSDEEICQGGTFSFATQATPASAVAYSSIVWTTSGTGSLFNANTLTPTYIPGPAEVGLVTFTLNAVGLSNCPGTSDQMQLTITPAPLANAGSDDFACEGSGTFDLSSRAVIATSANGSISWTHNGSGSLSSASVINPVYTLGPTDAGNTVTFTLTITSPSAVCAVVQDQFALKVNNRATVTVPADYVVCEQNRITLTGTIGGSAISGGWTVISGNGTLSVSSVTGTTVTANYDLDPSDVGTSLQFMLTTNDPDGTGPCTTVSDDVVVTVNQAARVDAGPDAEICEYENIQLNGSYSGSTSSVTWSPLPSGTFADSNDPQSLYTLSAAQRSATSLVLNFTLTTNDPDGAGPCTSVSDQVTIAVNDTTNVIIVGLNSIYAENSLPVVMTGFPAGGVFTGPGVNTATNTFVPANANLVPATNTIVYTYTDPVTTCVSAPHRIVRVNPLTTIDFVVQGATLDVNGEPQICANTGDVKLIGIPVWNSPQGKDLVGGEFTSPDIPSRIFFSGTDFFLKTDGLLAGTYIVRYTFTNTEDVVTVLEKNLVVFSAPKAIIDVNNSCIEDVITFEESSTIPNNLSGGTINQWNWDFDDNNNGSTAQEPTYQYTAPNTYLVKLRVTTDQGCYHDSTKSIRVGPVPQMKFDWTKFCSGESTQFVDQTDPGISTIDFYTWDFGDGNIPINGANGGNIPGGTHGGATTGTYKDPSHQYASFSEYDVTLTVQTNDGCVNSLTRRVFIQDSPVPTPTSGYFENFDGGPGTWVRTVANALVPTDTSWVWGLPYGRGYQTGKGYQPYSVGNNGWYTGANDSSYYNNEKSVLIGPCLDLTALERPMVSLDYWGDLDNRQDGVALQYSVDGGITWATVGDNLGAGINWYNANAINGNPGLQSLGQFGWTGETSGWKNARFNLDAIPSAERDQVIFRVALGTNSDNTPGVQFSGFALDNVYIGEKKRTVLVEYFTNVGINPTANAYLDGLYQDQFTVLGKPTSDFLKIQYHVANPSVDPINQANPVEPGARALYYGVLQPPAAVMDGILGNYYGKDFTGDFLSIKTEDIDRRALESPLFDLSVTELTTVTDDSIAFSLTYTYVDSLKPLTNPVVFNVALVEQNVSGNLNVLRGLLLGTEGTQVAQTWTEGLTGTITRRMGIDAPIGTTPNANLILVAFAQDRVTKRVHQALVLDASSKRQQQIVGVDDPVAEAIRDIQIYPNPASQYFNLRLDELLPYTYQYRLVDQRGVVVKQGDVNQDLTNGQEINIRELANGMYMFIISAGDKVLVQRKIAVMNRN